MMVKHVLWDWNGTLLDDVDVAWEVMNGMLTERGLPLLDRQRYTSAFRFPVEDYYRDIGLTEEPFALLAERFITAYIEANTSCSLQRGTEEVLAAVHASGRSQSVLSAAHQEVLTRDVARCAIGHHFTDLVGLSDHHARSKVEEGRAWLKRARLSPDAVVMVGDTDHDAEVAEAIGIGCVLMSHGHQDAARLRGTGLPVFEDLHALLGFLDR